MLLLGADPVCLVEFRRKVLLLQIIFRRRRGDETFGDEAFFDRLLMCVCGCCYRSLVERGRDKPIPSRHGNFAG